MSDPVPAPAEIASPPGVAAIAVLLVIVSLTGLEVVFALQRDPAVMADAIGKLFTVDALAMACLQVGLLVMMIAAGQILTGETWAPLGAWEGLTTGPGVRRALGLGIGLFLLLSFAIPSLAVLVMPSLADQHPDVLAGVIADLPTLFIAMAVASIGGGVREELWRVAWLRAWERLGPRWLTAGIGIGALAFGSLHLYQGPVAVAITALMGVVLGIRWERQRDAGELIVIHMVHNSLTVLLLYITSRAAAP